MEAPRQQMLIGRPDQLNRNADNSIKKGDLSRLTLPCVLV
jgi:hypothetical protein